MWLDIAISFLYIKLAGNKNEHFLMVCDNKIHLLMINCCKHTLKSTNINDYCVSALTSTKINIIFMTRSHFLNSQLLLVDNYY